MAKDEREEEREFLSGLKARTGRDLGEWMAAIAAQGSADKNEIIDWLREQSLPFARASWLERIHRNGGKPIYSGPTAKETYAKSRVDLSHTSRLPCHPRRRRPSHRHLPSSRRPLHQAMPRRVARKAHCRRQGLPPALSPARERDAQRRLPA